MKKIYREIEQCRICGNSHLVSILNLGNQALTGIFPTTKTQTVPSGPLELVKCHSDQPDQVCGLLQLRHSYQSDILYGENYGYRSGLNRSMVDHLEAKVQAILDLNILKPGDLVLDIGSNDGTLLRAYPGRDYTLVGIDPTGNKFAVFYPNHVQLIPDFFSHLLVERHFKGKKAKVITSIAMFYDLDDPLEFMRHVYKALDDEGIWVFEQSYMPTMLRVNAYDTVCHEHLEYYGLKQIKWLTDQVGFKIVDVELNDVNGGSFSVTVAKKQTSLKVNTAMIDQLIQKEQALDTLEPFQAFKKKVFDHRQHLIETLHQLKKEKQKVLGYGASTKGNVILQFCGLTKKDLPYFAEVNEDKWGRYTPGTTIPIISEAAAKALQPDYLLVMPWHFKQNIISREKDYLAKGGKLLFPLPKIEVINK